MLKFLQTSMQKSLGRGEPMSKIMNIESLDVKLTGETRVAPREISCLRNLVVSFMQ